MSAFEFKLPDIGEGIAEAEIARWRVAVGEAVEEDQPLVDMLTDKAAVELPSPAAGKVLEIRGAEGDKVPVGAVLVVIEAGAGAAQQAKPAATPVAAKSPPAKASPQPQPQSPPTPSGLKPMASPAVRRRAREQGIDLSSVRGSGPGGRITHKDLGAGSAKDAAPATSLQRRDGVESVKVIGMRRKIAEAMQRSKQRIPHFAYVEELDVSELEELRRHLNDTRKDGQPKLTLLPFLMRALVCAVREFPQVNARFDDEAGILHRHQAVHIGIATQTAQGLVVPVVQHAEARDLWNAATEVKRLADATRSGRAGMDELSGATITITSLGAMGGIASTPIINAPEVAVIGVNKIVERPVVWNGHISVRKCMNLSSSFDHRIVDGWDAAHFIQRVKALLEHPATLFME